MSLFLWLALATFASEDLACIAAGLLVAHGELDLATAIAACGTGIFWGDVGLYALGRLGSPAPERWRRARAWFERYGDAAVMISRFLPGFRVATYLAAGALRMPLGGFVPRLAIAVAAWTTLAVGGTALLGHAPNLLWLVVPALAWLVMRHTRWGRWEFWPAWLAYLPVIPYILWLALRHRSLTAPLRSNPGMKNGGLVGEAKSASLALLRRGAPEHVPPFLLVKARPAAVEFPVVLKPDVGERGRGVAIVRNEAELAAYDFSKPTIVQPYIGGEEFGLFYRAGELTSITRKVFPVVTGDGERTLRELIDADERARLIAGVYRPNEQSRIPAAGEQVPLVEIGSHCRGTIFLDGRHLWTARLAEAVHRVAKAHEGFHFGRFDVRAASEEALRRGEFQVLELNGVGGEPAHIYDPSVTWLEAYRTLFAHWRDAFAIGVQNSSKPPGPSRAKSAGVITQPASNGASRISRMFARRLRKQLGAERMGVAPR